MSSYLLSGTVEQKFNQVNKILNDISNAVNARQQSLGFTNKGKEGDIQIVEDSEKNKLLLINTNDGWYSSFRECFQPYKAGSSPKLKLRELEVDNLFAKQYTISNLKAISGNQIMSAGDGIVDAVLGNTIWIKDQNNLNICSFAVNDKCEIRTVNPSTNAVIRLVQFTVNAVSGRVLSVTYTGTSRPQVGDIAVVLGSSSDTTRQNSIYFSTVDTNSPYIDLITGTNSFTLGTTILRIGNLTGITDSDFGGALSGYGIYTTNAYFKGKIYLANNGAISLGKTAYNDTTNAGFWFGDSDATASINPYFYLGNAGDTKYLKIDTVAGTFNTLGFTITGGLIQTATAGNNRVVLDGSDSTLKFYYGATLVGIVSATSTAILDFNAASVRASTGLYAGSFNAGSNAIGGGGVSTGQFSVDGNGNLVRLNNITYSFPSVAPTLNQVLTCSNATGGVLSWVTPSATMVYPGAGIALSTGAAWGTSITDNSSNWNTAYGWGNHASAGYYVGSASTIKGLFSATSPLSYNNSTGIFSLAGLSSLGADGQLIRVNSGATAWEYFTPSYLTSLSGAVLTTTDQTITGTKTFNGNVVFGASIEFTLPTADPSPNIGRFWRSTDVLKYTNSGGTVRTLATTADLSSYALTNQTMYLGTTAVNINRSSGALSLAGVSIDGNAGTVTNGVYTNANNSFSGSTTYTNSDITADGDFSASGKTFIRLNYGALGVANDITDGATGQVLYITNINASNNWVFEDGTGNLRLYNSSDCVLGYTDTLMLVYNGSYWVEISRSDN